MRYLAKGQEESAATDAIEIVTGGRRGTTEIVGTIEESRREIMQIPLKTIAIMRTILTTTKFCRRRIRIIHRT